MCVADGCSIYLAHNIYFGRCSSHFAFCIYDWNATQSTNCIFLFWFFFWLNAKIELYISCDFELNAETEFCLLLWISFQLTVKRYLSASYNQHAVMQLTPFCFPGAIVSCLIFNICSSSTNLNWAEKYSSFDRNRAFIFMIWHAKHAEAARGFK